jgi:hypothetical protein
MIHLINGRGQLGEELKKVLSDVKTSTEMCVYHTWNVQDKSEEAQQEEYIKFQAFVDAHSSTKIMFISTKSQRETWYTHYKQLAEAYAILYCKEAIITRLPTIVGKGVVEKFESGDADPYGTMELITTGRAAREVIDLCSYTGPRKSFDITGDIVSAELVYNLVRRKQNV